MIFDSDAGQQTWLAENGIAPFFVDAMSTAGPEFVESPTFEEKYWPSSADGLSPGPSSATPPDIYGGDYFSLCESGPSSPDHNPKTPDFFIPTPQNNSYSAVFRKSLPAQRGGSPYIRRYSHGDMIDDSIIAPESSLVLSAEPANFIKQEDDTWTSSASSPSGNSENSSTSTRKLRTASKKPKKSSKTKGAASNKPAVPDQVLQARASHNLVERQYRNRLNKQFEQLLAILPAPRGGDGDPEDPCCGDDSRRFSKAEVLLQARRRIQILERENAQLAAERDQLMMSVRTIQRR